MSEEQGVEEQPQVVASVGAVSDGGYTLLVADFADTSTAWQAYEALQGIEDGRHLQIDGVIVVKRSPDGELDVEKATDHSTKRGLKWGLIGGAALGLVFPPSLLGSAAAVGGVGAAVGKGRQMHHRHELKDELADAIQPGHSGIVALVSDPGVIEIRRALAMADTMVESAVEDVIAKDIKAAAKEAEEAGNADD